MMPRTFSGFCSQHLTISIKEQLEGPSLTGGGTGKKCGRNKHRMVEEAEDKGDQCQLHWRSQKRRDIVVNVIRGERQM